MKRLFLFFICLSFALLCLSAPPPASADASHARIVRLSLVQGDVRFSREFHKDSLEDSKATWEVAPLNLPIRQGYAIATDNNGRAEVEFENGAMAFLSANTLVEFYDLSLDEGAHITRLILRQGSAIFYVHPAQNDYFSVTGGDFSVEANSRTRFRLDNFDDGSKVNVETGQINVLRNKTSKPLEKGQSYSVDINNASAPVTVARASDDDDFEKWVSGRIDAVATATAYSSQYVNSPGYTSGFADLYNYGAFYNVPGYGYGWQPYGVGMGWSPFAFGNWYSDPFLGWNFISFAPWGWLPFHYGSWMFGPMGWMWMPTGFGYGGLGYGYGYGGGVPIAYHPITAVWVRSGTTTGLVPISPVDKPGKAPANLAQGIYTLHDNSVSAIPVPAGAEKWSIVKNPPRESLSATTLAASTPPTRVSRTILSGTNRPVTLSRDSSIVYDPSQHRFVNANNSRTAAAEAKPPAVNSTEKGTVANAVAGANSAHTPDPPTIARSASVPARPHISPPNPPHAPGGAAWDDVTSTSPGPSSSSSHTTTSSPATGHSGGGHH